MDCCWILCLFMLNRSHNVNHEPNCKVSPMFSGCSEDGWDSQGPLIKLAFETFFRDRKEEESAHLQTAQKLMERTCACNCVMSDLFFFPAVMLSLVFCTSCTCFCMYNWLLHIFEGEMVDITHTECHLAVPLCPFYAIPISIRFRRLQYAPTWTFSELPQSGLFPAAMSLWFTALLTQIDAVHPFVCQLSRCMRQQG